MELAVIGRQVQTDHGGRIDLLALDRDGGCVIIELKKARTPREIVAQLLDYASWVVDLTFDRLEVIAQSSKSQTLQAIYEAAFGSSLPETVNTSHHMILVAAELDASSERIINYLADRHDISINAVFVPDGEERPLMQLPLKARRASVNSESPELSEWAVGVKWSKTFDRDKARTFRGAFANQNIVCKLRDERMIEFLQAEFGVSN